jgi:hypothetical protein
MTREEIEQEVSKALKDQFGLQLEDIHTVKITLNLARQDSRSCFAAEDAISDAIHNSKYKTIRTLYGGRNLNEIFLASSATPAQLEAITRDALPEGTTLSKIEELDVKFYDDGLAIVRAAPKQG